MKSQAHVKNIDSDKNTHRALVWTFEDHHGHLEVGHGDIVDDATCHGVELVLDLPVDVIRGLGDHVSWELIQHMHTYIASCARLPL